MSNLPRPDLERERAYWMERAERAEATVTRLRRFMSMRTLDGERTELEIYEAALAQDAEQADA